MKPVVAKLVDFIIDEEHHEWQHEEPYQCEEQKKVFERDEVLIMIIGVKSPVHEYRRVDEDTQ